MSDPYVGTFRLSTSNHSCFKVVSIRFANDDGTALNYNCQYVDRWGYPFGRGKEFSMGHVPMKYETEPWSACTECEERPVRPDDFLCARCRNAFFASVGEMA